MIMPIQIQFPLILFGVLTSKKMEQFGLGQTTELHLQIRTKVFINFMTSLNYISP